MCRVLIRQPTQQAREQGANPAPFSLLDELRGGYCSESIKLEDPGFGFDSLVASSGTSLEDDLDLFSMFGEVPDSLASPATTPAVALAPVAAGALAQPSLLAPAYPVPGFMPSGAMAFPADAFHANFLAQQAAALSGATKNSSASEASGAVLLRPAGRRNRTPKEVADQVERTKKRRRESAQRSRTRRNCYMKALEVENGALKEELALLRAALTAAGVDHCSIASSSTGGAAIALREMEETESAMLGGEDELEFED